MSKARYSFIKDVSALSQAVSSPSVATASGLKIDPGVTVLRRGAAIAGLVMLEAFVRDRTEEILEELRDWPADYEDLPSRFRSQATIGALANIEKFAKMLKRQNDDFEAIIIEQAGRLASMSPPAFQFTKFIAGDYTGNISVAKLEELLRVFQVKDCWRMMHSFSVDVGYGIPSVKEILNSIVGNRHKSAHVSGFNPTASDMADLPQNLLLVGLCVDATLSACARTAVEDWRSWVSNTFDWKSRLEVFFLIPKGDDFRLIKQGATRALKIVAQPNETKRNLPKRSIGSSVIVIQQGPDGSPCSWDIV